MPQIGPLEIMVVGVIALIAFGPQRLPEMARTVARFLNELRRQAADVSSEFEAAMRVDDDEPTGTERPRIHRGTTNPAEGPPEANGTTD